MARNRTPPDEPPRRRRAATPPAEEQTTAIVEPAASGPVFQLSPWAAAVAAALVASLAALGLAIAAFVTRSDGSASVRVPIVQGFRGFAPGAPGGAGRFRLEPGFRGGALPRPYGG
jgi:hypothetical protein